MHYLHYFGPVLALLHTREAHQGRQGLVLAAEAERCSAENAALEDELRRMVRPTAAKTLKGYNCFF